MKVKDGVLFVQRLRPILENLDRITDGLELTGFDVSVGAFFYF